MKFTKKLSAILLAVIMVFGVMTVAVCAEDNAARYITGTVDVTLTAPVAGELASTDCTSWNNKVIVSELVWLDADGEAFTSKYESEASYTARLTVMPSDGYLFDEEFAITVNGETATVVASDENSLTVEATFTCEKADDNSSSSSSTSIWSILLGIIKIIRDLIAHFIGY